jgi:hypothetical protein
MEFSELLTKSLNSTTELNKPFRIGYRMVPIVHIPVQIVENDEDWTFTFVDRDGAKVMAVF